MGGGEVYDGDQIEESPEKSFQMLDPGFLHDLTDLNRV